MLIRLTIIFLLAAQSLSALAAIASPENANTEKALPLSLLDCLEKALSANLDLAVERINPAISATDLLRAEGFYDLRLRTDAQYGETSSPRTAEQIAADGVLSSRSQTNRLEGSLLQRFSPGTELGLTTNTRNSPSTFNNFRDEWSSFSGATFTQPLLKGFGTDTNLAQLRIARRGTTAAEAALEYRVEQIITNVAEAYYELIFTRDNFKAREESLRLAEQLLVDNKTRVDVGVMSPIDISQANAEVAARREEVLRAQRSIRNQENTLRRLISADIASLLDHPIIPTDLPPENWLPESVSYDVAEGLKSRADYRQARDLLARGKLDEALRKNQLFPQLNLRGQYGYGGLDKELDTSYHEIVDTYDPQWFVGLTLELPFQNREARSAYESAQLRRRQQELTLKRIEQEIIVEIDNTAGQAETNRQRITAARTARELAEESVRNESEKLQAGVSTSYTLLQLQRDSANARINELRAIADFQKSRAALARVQGQSRRLFQVELTALR